MSDSQDCVLEVPSARISNPLDFVTFSVSQYRPVGVALFNSHVGNAGSAPAGITNTFRHFRAFDSQV